jgi:hypothetical protein
MYMGFMYVWGLMCMEFDVVFLYRFVYVYVQCVWVGNGVFIVI